MHDKHRRCSMLDARRYAALQCNPIKWIWCRTNTRNNCHLRYFYFAWASVAVISCTKYRSISHSLVRLSNCFCIVAAFAVAVAAVRAQKLLFSHSAFFCAIDSGLRCSTLVQNSTKWTAPDQLRQHLWFNVKACSPIRGTLLWFSSFHLSYLSMDKLYRASSCKHYPPAAGVASHPMGTDFLPSVFQQIEWPPLDVYCLIQERACVRILRTLCARQMTIMVNLDGHNFAHFARIWRRYVLRAHVLTHQSWTQ